jgi:hypothetical protein
MTLIIHQKELLPKDHLSPNTMMRSLLDNNPPIKRRR